MPNVQPNTPSLLTLTASRESTAAPPAEEGRFAAQLSEASEGSKSKEPKAQSPDEDLERTTTNEPPSERDTDQASEETTTDEASSVASTDELLVEETLLSVAVATETIVLETPLDAELPPEASTQLDVVASDDSLLQDDLSPVSSLQQEGEAVTAQPVVSTENATGGAAPAPTEVDTAADGQVADAPTKPSDLLAPNDSNVDTQATASGEGLSFGEHAGERSEAPASSNASPLASETPAVGNAADSSAASSPEASVPDDAQPGPTDQSKPAAPPAPPAEPIKSREKPESAEDAEASLDEATSSNRESSAERGSAKPGAARSERAESRPTIDPARFVSRVSRAIDSAQQRGGGPVEMRLSPPELGSLQVRIEVKEGVMTASLDVETPAARNALLDNLPALRDRLEQQQIRIEKFDVDVRDESQQRGGEQHRGDDRQPTGENPRRDSEQSRRPDRADQPQATQANAAKPSTPSIDFGDQSVNLVA